MDLIMLRNIPNGKTRTIQGNRRNEACRNFALTGGTNHGGDWVAHLFGLINLGRQDNPLSRRSGTLAAMPGMKPWSPIAGPR
jgi:hypothetical protein